MASASAGVLFVLKEGGEHPSWSYKPPEADRCHCREPCGELGPPRQQRVIAQEALQRLDLFEQIAQRQTHDLKAKVRADGRERCCGTWYWYAGSEPAAAAIPSAAGNNKYYEDNDEKCGGAHVASKRVIA